ncbi:MAG: hypothetical protein ACYTBJ_25925 [Planctomycetota bacterium]|jgi:hypothetical protein
MALTDPTSGAGYAFGERLTSADMTAAWAIVCRGNTLIYVLPPRAWDNDNGVGLGWRDVGRTVQQHGQNRGIHRYR